MEPHLRWRLGSGRWVNCWTDSWLSDGTKLENTTLRPLSGTEKFLRVCDITSNDSLWDSTRLGGLVPIEAQQAILHMKSLSPQSGEDCVAWALSSDGNFSNSLAYDSLLDQGLNLHFPLFKRIWRWPGPQRERLHLWKMALGAFMTNDTRKKRHLINDAMSPICKNREETLMLLFIDCDKVTELWWDISSGLLPPLFFNEINSAWIDLNLSQDIAIEEVNWGGLFWDHYHDNMVDAQ